MRSHIRELAWILPACLLLGSVSIVRAQTLADVAKQEEDRRKTIREPAKVYTNKDLHAAPPVISSSPDAAKPADAASSGEPGGGDKSADAGKASDKNDKTTDGKDSKGAKDANAKEKGPAKDQAYWAGRLKDLKAQLDRDQTFADALQSRINALSADFVARDDPAQKAAIARDKQKALDELERLKKAIQNDKKALSDLEDEARRAGAPAGWLRS